MAPPPVKLDTVDRSTLQTFHRTWPMRWIPDGLKPYAELMRLHRPAGIMMFYFPCLYGAFLVGSLSRTPISPSDMLLVNAKLLLLSFLMRGTFCTWNDIIDQEIDRQVKRTRIRPLARRAISTPAAIVWTVAQAAMMLAVYAFALPSDCLVASSVFLVLHVLYPWMKRVLHHPQVILGLAYPLGVFIAFPAFDQPIANLLSGANAALVSLNTTIAAALFLSAAIFLWTVLNDTIYAAQDTQDDEKAGVGSPMVYWGRSARGFLRVLALLQVLALVGVSLGMADNASTGGVIYVTLTCGATVVSLISMVEFVDLGDPTSCGWWFNKGNLLVGYAIASGLVAEYAAGVTLPHELLKAGRFF